MNFIHVFNDELKDRLIKYGYLLISSINGLSIFENNIASKFNFSEVDNKKYTFTNKMVF